MTHTYSVLELLNAAGDWRQQIRSSSLTSLQRDKAVMDATGGQRTRIVRVIETTTVKREVVQ